MLKVSRQVGIPIPHTHYGMSHARIIFATVIYIRGTFYAALVERNFRKLQWSTYLFIM